MCHRVAKSDLYVAFLALLEAKRAVVLDHGKYRTQAVGLERRIVCGNEVIDHPASSHDDIVNAVAGVLFHATRAARIAQKMPAGATWWSPSTCWVEPNRPAPNRPPAHYLADYSQP